MKFLIDAQLPRRLAAELKQAGFEATHTLELPDGNRIGQIASSLEAFDLIELNRTNLICHL
jgi:predicted nuclease of predicted toxin-antitoxin system